jgi:hypothetical protein
MNVPFPYVSVKEKEVACISPEEVTELYAQLEQAKTKLFHFKDPNRASQKVRRGQF